MCNILSLNLGQQRPVDQLLSSPLKKILKYNPTCYKQYHCGNVPDEMKTT